MLSTIDPCKTLLVTSSDALRICIEGSAWWWLATMRRTAGHVFFFARDVPVAEEGAAEFVGIVWRFGSGIAVCDDVCDGRAELRVLRNFFARDPRLH